MNADHVTRIDDSTATGRTSFRASCESCTWKREIRRGVAVSIDRAYNIALTLCRVHRGEEG